MQDELNAELRCQSGCSSDITKGVSISWQQKTMLSL